MPKPGTREFQAQVQACAAQVMTYLPELARRHSPLMVLAALSEHVGGGLYLCQKAGACSPAQARAVLQDIEERIFPDR